MKFTAEELAEMAQADAEIEASFCITPEDLELDEQIDRFAIHGQGSAEASREHQRCKYIEHKTNKTAYLKAYWAANREWINQYQRCKRKARQDGIGARQGASVAAARKARGYTQVELAALLGVGASTLAGWESGAIPPKWHLLSTVLPELEKEANHDQ